MIHGAAGPLFEWSMDEQLKSSVCGETVGHSRDVRKTK